MRRLWKKIKYKFVYAIRGIWITMVEEKSLWFHNILFLMVIGFGIYFKISFVEWAIIFTMSAMVIAFEILNTAMEALVDMVAFEYNLKVKKIKDIAAGATLVASIFAIVVGLLIFVPIIIRTFG